MSEYVAIWVPNNSPEMSAKARGIAGRRCPGKTCLYGEPALFSDEDLTQPDVILVIVPDSFPKIIVAYRGKGIRVRVLTEKPGALRPVQPMYLGAETVVTEYVDREEVAAVAAASVAEARREIVGKRPYFLRGVLGLELQRQRPRKTLLSAVRGQLCDA